MAAERRTVRWWAMGVVPLLTALLTTGAGQGAEAAAGDPRYDQGDVAATFESVDQTIDCVDLLAQPGLQRPGMSAEEIDLEPPEVIQQAEVATGADDDQPATVAVGLQPVDCPDGTVPIVRRTADELAAAADRDRANAQARRNFATQSGSTDHHQYAVVRRDVSNFGAESDLNIWAPHTESSSEFTLSQIWVQRGNGSNLETVEAGWQKYRDLYGDWNAHLFIYFTPDAYGPGGCYNLDCSGFVQVDNSYTIGGTFTASSLGGPQYYARIAIVKGGATGDWWLQVGGVWLGYWPRSLFDSHGLRDEAATVTYGGEIINNQPNGQHTATDMGSGRFPGHGFGQAAFQKRLHFVDLSMTQQRLTNTYTIVTDWSCYGIDRKSSTDDNWREFFYFGGSGRNASCT